MSLEGMGPGPSGRWSRRAADVHNGWVAGWLKILRDSPGTMRADGPLGRWPFSCKRCGANFHGLTPPHIRTIHKNVELVANHADETRRKRALRISATPKCCTVDNPVLLTFRLDGARPKKTAVLVDMNREDDR